jgi:hypothetical protein
MRDTCSSRVMFVAVDKGANEFKMRGMLGKRDCMTAESAPRLIMFHLPDFGSAGLNS